MSTITVAQSSLHLYEEIMLLALREDNGKIESKARFEYSTLLAAALLSELVLLERIAIQNKKKMIVEVTSREPVGCSLLDEALSTISDSKPKPATHWVTKLQRIKNLQARAAQSLCDKGILKAEDGKVLFFFDKTYYPELNPMPEQEVISRLQSVIFGDDTDIDERTLVLLALLRKSELLKIPFEAKALKNQRHRMKEICEGDLIGEAAQKTVEAAQAAMMVAVIIPAVTTTVITN